MNYAGWVPYMYAHNYSNIINLINIKKSLTLNP